MGWDAFSCGVYKVDMYEQARSKERREKADNLRIPVMQRAEILIRSGYHIQDIAAATLEAETIRRERAQTFHRKKLDRLQLAVESAGERLKSGIRGASYRRG